MVYLNDEKEPTMRYTRNIITLALLGCNAFTLDATTWVWSPPNSGYDFDITDCGNWKNTASVPMCGSPPGSALPFLAGEIAEFGVSNQTTADYLPGYQGGGATLSTAQWQFTGAGAANSNYTFILQEPVKFTGGGVSNPLGSLTQNFNVNSTKGTITFNNGASSNSATESFTTDTNQVYYNIGDGTNANTMTFQGSSGGVGGYVTINSNAILALTGTPVSGTDTVNLAELSTDFHSEVQIAANNNLTVGASNGNTFLNGPISGEGSFTKVGSGELTMSGANTYSGGTTVSGGILSGNTESLQGNILNNATLDFDEQTSAGTFAGVVSGSGTITMEGFPLTFNTNQSAFSGTTNADNNALILNNILGGNVNVLNGTVLKGNGTVGGNLTILSGGTISPGNSAGTISVLGNYAQQNNATYIWEAFSPSQTDLVNVSGTATRRQPANHVQWSCDPQYPLSHPPCQRRGVQQIHKHLE